MKGSPSAESHRSRGGSSLGGEELEAAQERAEPTEMQRDSAVEIQRYVRGHSGRLTFMPVMHLAGGALGQSIEADVLSRMGLEAHAWALPSDDTTSGRAGMPAKVQFKDGPGNLPSRRNGDLATPTAASARADLLFASVTSGTEDSYSSQFGHWIVWRRARGDPLLLDPSETSES